MSCRRPRPPSTAGHARTAVSPASSAGNRGHRCSAAEVPLSSAPQPLPAPPPLALAMTTGAGSLNAGVPVEAPGVVNDVVIEGVESGAGFETTAVGAMVGGIAVGGLVAGMDIA